MHKLTRQHTAALQHQSFAQFQAASALNNPQYQASTVVHQKQMHPMAVSVPVAGS